MRVEFYYDSPEMGNQISHHVAAELLLNKCKETYNNIEFKKIDARQHLLDNNLEYHPEGKYSPFFTMILNPDNGKYFLISYWDKLYQVLENYGNKWDLENCVETFSALGIHRDDIHYKDAGLKYTPISYFSITQHGEKKVEELYLNEKVIPSKPFFRGGKYLFRKWISDNDNRFEIDHNRVYFDESVAELAKYSINIDLPSVAEITSRTIEAMGLKTALIRPKLTLKFHNDLIPGFHYAAVDCDDVSDYQKLADAYIDKFEYLKANPDYVKFLSENGRKWYEENGTIDAHTNILLKLIDFEKLK